MASSQILLTLVYALAVLTAGIGAVELSGFFPAAARPAALRRTGGRLLIGLLALSLMALALVALWLGVTGLPWPAVIIAGGLALLLAPLIFQLVPHSFWDSPRGVGAATLAAAAWLALLLHVYVW